MHCSTTGMDGVYCWTNYREIKSIIVPLFNYKKLYTVLSCLGVFTFCTCCKILICLVASFKLSFV